MSRRKVRSIIVVFFIIIVVIVFLPFPKYVNTTIPGYEMIGNEIVESVEMKVKGWYFNYLFRSDKMKGTLTITPYRLEEENRAVFEIIGSAVFLKVPGFNICLL